MQLTRWAARPEQTVERLRAAGERLARIQAATPSRVSAIYWTAQSGLNRIDSARRGDESGAPDDAFGRRWAFWEAVRARRLWTATIAAEIDFFNANAQQLAATGSLPELARPDPESQTAADTKFLFDGPYSGLEPLYLPGRPALHAEAVAMTLRKLIAVGIELRAYQLEHLRLPEALDELTLAGPRFAHLGNPLLDAWSGRPIHLDRSYVDGKLPRDADTIASSGTWSAVERAFPNGCLFLRVDTLVLPVGN